MAARKKKFGWGGKRPGAGRPPKSGKRLSKGPRNNLVAVMFTDAELRKLKRLARKRGLPFSTLAYKIIKRTLDRQ